MPQSPPTPVVSPPEPLQQLLIESRQIQGTSLGRDAWRRMKRNRAAVASLVFLVVLASASVLTPLLPLQSYKEQHLKERQYDRPNLTARSLDLEKLRADPKKYETRLLQLFEKPSGFDRALIRIRLTLFGDRCVPSLCGTDGLGRDLLSRLFWGSRVSLTVGIVATLVSLIIGVSYGATAGYLGGWVDEAMMRFVDILYSIPFMFVVIFLISILDDEEIKKRLLEWGINKIVIFYLILGAVSWLTMSRIVRGQVISLKHEQFVEAARAVGAGQARIIFLHLVPNLLGIVIVYLTLTIPSVMLYEAFLSFLGLGVQNPEVSWGKLASEGVRVINPIEIAWWLVLFPGLALAMTLFALNFLGDGLRDALDPRMKNK
ncbi:MAG: ABC transporter permease [Planctomycetes bacterium]|nr:ABC transporter permease [Planctomycetota bacterium]